MGAFGVPIRRESWATVISVGDGMMRPPFECKFRLNGEIAAKQGTRAELIGSD
jgi:hypothetical protein